MDASGSVQFYLPEGTWTHLETGEQLLGPAWHTKTFSVLSAATYVRPGAVIPMGTVNDRPEYAWNKEVEFIAFAPSEGQQSVVSIPTQSGGTAFFDVTVTKVDGGASQVTAVER